MRKVLVVEDDPAIQLLLTETLRSRGYEPHAVADGLEALPAALQHRPDVVLLDMVLPRCDGATTVRAIRRDPACAGLKIFAVTGRSPDDFDLARGPAGVDRWLQKPLDPGVLLHSLNQELAP